VTIQNPFEGGDEMKTRDVEGFSSLDKIELRAREERTREVGNLIRIKGFNHLGPKNRMGEK